MTAKRQLPAWLPCYRRPQLGAQSVPGRYDSAFIAQPLNCNGSKPQWQLADTTMLYRSALVAALIRFDPLYRARSDRDPFGWSIVYSRSSRSKYDYSGPGQVFGQSSRSKYDYSGRLTRSRQTAGASAGSSHRRQTPATCIAARGLRTTNVRSRRPAPARQRTRADGEAGEHAGAAACGRATTPLQSSTCARSRLRTQSRALRHAWRSTGTRSTASSRR
jgi:hypothetical protein